MANAVGDDVTVRYNLHPPMLRALGLDAKMELGPWFTPVLKNLARGKKVRGTRLDPFGRAEVRRVERELVDEYEQLVSDLARRTDEANLDTAVELASLPDLVRGYEDVKLGNVERYHTEMARLRADLGL